MCFLLDRVNVRKCSRVCLSGLTLILTAKTISWTLFIQYQLLWRAVVTACFVSMMSDWWTLGLKKKESHHLEIIHTNASVHAVFSQSSPLDLKTTSISFHWLLRTEEPVLIQGRGGGCFNKWRHFYPVHCLWKFWHYCTEPTSICFWNMA